MKLTLQVLTRKTNLKKPVADKFEKCKKAQKERKLSLFGA